VINYNLTSGINRDPNYGANGLQQFPALGTGTIYGINTTTSSKRYGAGQGISSNTAFVSWLVDRTGVLQDTASPFNTGLAGLITTTTIDQTGRILAGGNYGTNSQLTCYTNTGTRASGFGTTGVAFGDLATTATINKVINSGTGYLVAAVSNTNQFTTALYSSAGALNTAYNTTGIVRETGVGVSAAYDMLLNGTALAVSGYTNTNSPSVINYNSSTGARDTSISTNGVQQFPVLGTGTIYALKTTTGTKRYGAGQGTNSNTAFVSLLVNRTGVLQDTASPFNTNQPALIYSTTLTQTGNILAAAVYNSTWQVISYTSAAVRTPGFGTNGVAGAPGFSGSARPRAIVVDSVGRIIVAGTSMVLGTSVFTVVRYNADGTVDTVVQETDLGEGSGLGILMNNDNSFSVAGNVMSGADPTPIVIDYDANCTQSNVRQFDALTPGYFFATQTTGGKEYAAGSTEDTALLYPLLDGTGLLQDTDVPFQTGYNGRIYSGCIDENDNITLCGNYNNSWMVVKYTGVGERDITFSTDGVILDSTLGVANAHAIIQDTNGNYYVAGESTVDGTSVLTIAKYDSTGAYITSFGNNGIVQLTGYGQSRAYNLALTSNNTLLVAGQITMGGTLYPALLAYDATGMLIPSFGTQGVQTYEAFGTGSLYSTVVDATANTATSAGQTGNSATLVQTSQESIAAQYIASGF
jgi:uncharacterized delta-60 repeat protein